MRSNKKLSFEDIVVKVMPSSKKVEIEEMKIDSIGLFSNQEMGVRGSDLRVFKVRLKSQPEGGKANKELLEAMSGFLKVCKLNIQIIKGLTYRTKTLRVFWIDQAGQKK